MADLILSGSTSGTVTVSSPAISGSSVLTLPASTDTLVGKATTDTLTNKTLTAPAISSAVMSTMASSVLTSATAQNSTSGTVIDFPSIPSWVKRITVMFNGVSTNGTSFYQVQLGAGSVTTSGYTATIAVTTAVTNSSTGLIFCAPAAATLAMGLMTIANVTGNTWVSASNVFSSGSSNATGVGSGQIALAGTLDRVRITTVNGTDTFDAGSINIIYE